MARGQLLKPESSVTKKLVRLLISDRHARHQIVETDVVYNHSDLQSHLFPASLSQPDASADQLFGPFEEW
jgi:hypothetical protein